MIGEHCRLYGHHWDSILVEYDRWSWWDHLECDRCGTRSRVEISKATGRTAKRSYTYPEGYLQKEKITRAEFRKKIFPDRGVVQYQQPKAR